jgi:hypothetical protein
LYINCTLCVLSAPCNLFIWSNLKFSSLKSNDFLQFLLLYPVNYFLFAICKLSRLFLSSSSSSSFFELFTYTVLASLLFNPFPSLVSCSIYLNVYQSEIRTGLSAGN